MSPRNDRETDLDETAHRLRAAIEDDLVLLVRRPGLIETVAVPVGAQIVVGRGDDATIRVEDTKVSRRHAIVRRFADKLVVEDLGSRNGTWVEGTVVREGAVPLALGDVVRVGEVEIAPARAVWGAGEVDGVAVVAVDRAMQKIMDAARVLAHSAATVLLCGETGVGKEVVATEIHRRGPRAAMPFVKVNCARMPEAEIDRHMYGWEANAFPGADHGKPGLVESARGGTVLLDHIGDLPLGAQAKLLRLLEHRAVQRVGGSEELVVDVRFIATTQRDLRAEAEAGRFRKDLLFRLEGVRLDIPPLRERPVEISLLAHHFARAAARGPVDLERDAHVQLVRYSWPGNVLELKNAMEQAVVLGGVPVIRLEHLPEPIRGAVAASPVTGAAMAAPSAAGASRRPRVAAIQPEVEEVERRHIERALAANNGNRTRTAGALGISRRALLYKIAKYGLS